MSQAPAVQLKLEQCRGSDAKTRQSPAHASSAQASYSLRVAPGFLSRIYGQEYRYPVLNKKRSVALGCPLSKTEKPPFN